MRPTPQGHFDREVCRPFYHKGNENAIVLIHGFTGSAAHMRKLADGLAERGYTVRTINLPGHAMTEADMAKADWQMWLQAAKQAVLDMMAEARVVTVGGLSMGGVLALLVAQQMKVDGCVAISAPMGAKNKFLPLSRLLCGLVPRVSWREQPERQTLLDQAYDFGYSGFPTARGGDLHTLIKLARRNLFNITCPILCVQSDSDESVAPGSADTILENVSSEVRQKLWLHGVPHVCTLSSELPAIVEAVETLMIRAEKEKASD